MKYISFIRTVVAFILTTTFAAFSYAGVGADSIRPVMIGSDAPDASVLDSGGNSIGLGEIYDGKPTIVVFYRGGWCPYCNTHLRELVDIEPQLIEMGYQVIALSPDSPSKLQESADKGGLSYSLYSDSPHEAAEAFGVAFTLKPKTLERYQKKNRLGGYSDGINEDKLPVPSVFIVTADQKIAFQYVDPNYRSRMPGDLLLAAAKTSLEFGK